MGGPGGHDDDATAATRILTQPAPVAAPARADGPGASSAADLWRRRPAWLVPAAAIVAALLLLAVLLPAVVGALASDADPAPSPTPLPSVPGDLGVHLRELEEAVAP